MQVSPVHINTLKEAKQLMRTVGTTSCGVDIMAPKTLFFTVEIKGISSYAANIIKQHLLSFGSDAAISRDSLTKPVKTSLIIFGTLYQLEKLIEKLRFQPFELKRLALELEELLAARQKKHFKLTLRQKQIALKPPLICGIINLTTDSFSHDGLLKNNTAANDIMHVVIRKVRQMIRAGAKMIDIGAESSRPYARAVPVQKELKRIVPVIKRLRKDFPRLPISVDTYKYDVAKYAIESGADIINDITALKNAPNIIRLLKKYKRSCVLMHMKGTPRTMQNNPKYKNVLDEVFNFLQERVSYCITRGISKEQIMVDPGIGFGKTTEDNLLILNNLYRFKTLGVPVFVGVSRKSFIGNTLGLGVSQRLIGTVAAVVTSFLNGADILRVHDVKEMREALTVAHKITESCQVS